MTPARSERRALPFRLSEKLRCRVKRARYLMTMKAPVGVLDGARLLGLLRGNGCARRSAVLINGPGSAPPLGPLVPTTPPPAAALAEPVEPVIPEPPPALPPTA